MAILYGQYSSHVHTFSLHNEREIHRQLLLRVCLFHALRSHNKHSGQAGNVKQYYQQGKKQKNV